MRKGTKQAVTAFLVGERFGRGNRAVIGEVLYLFGNPIARRTATNTLEVNFLRLQYRYNQRMP